MNLSIQLAPKHRQGLLLANPVMTASGTFGYGTEYSHMFDIQKLGAIVCKGTTLDPRDGNPQPRLVETAGGLLNSIGLEKLAPLFFNQMARTLSSPGEAKLLSELAKVMKLPQSSVRLAKIAFNRGLPIADYAYPTNMMPKYKEINVPVEPALIYALSRQESEFNPIAKSSAGARGIMQIMPRTARAIARQHKVRYRRSSLTKKPSYNVMLGVAHLGDLLASYNGSYIMTLVAYNAGGGRVKNWVKDFGDPRGSAVDAIDWVERIPFTETRNYVKKILTSVQIYRARLNDPKEALQLLNDLNRGRQDKAALSKPLSGN